MLDNIVFPSVTDPLFLIFLLGVLLWSMGARFYRLVILCPGFVVGAYFGMNSEFIKENITQDPMLVTVVVGIVGAIALSAVERLAIALLGALAALGILHNIHTAFFSGTMSVYAQPIAALIGALIFPFLWNRMLFVVTSLAGSLCICHSVGLTEDSVALVVLWMVGAVFQKWVKSKPPPKAET